MGPIVMIPEILLNTQDFSAARLTTQGVMYSYVQKCLRQGILLMCNISDELSTWQLELVLSGLPQINLINTD
jgi:hypothetical protein